jgi:hypothetical protein
VEQDQALFDKVEAENLFLTIERNNLCYRSKDGILDLLENKKNKGAIKKETRIVGKNTKEEAKAPVLKPARGREDAE